MKLLHTGDLHLGKKLNKISLIEDQKQVLKEIVKLSLENHIDALIISGDIYDRSIPSEEAQDLFESFLVDISKNHITTFIIKGNHDSNRVGYAKKFLSFSSIFINENLSNSFVPIKYKDTNFYLLPYFSFYEAKQLFADSDFESINDAYKAVIAKMNIDKSETNILLAHDAILPIKNEIEFDGSEINANSVGGLDTVGVSVFKDFDYVALGHIHKPQTIFKDKVRYSGSILKYHPKESKTEKSVTLVNIENKIVSISTIPLHPLRNLINEELYFKDALTRPSTDDFIYFRLLDTNAVESGMSILRERFPNILGIEYPNIKSRFVSAQEISTEEVIKQSGEKLFNDFFKKQNDRDLDSAEKDIVLDIFKTVERKAQ
jgi:exonuclease SbcD